MKLYGTHIIIEGIDRLGKGTLINNILNNIWYFHVIHFTKPEVLKVLDTDGNKTNALSMYQFLSFMNGFRILNSNNTNLIFDRFHLGEYVYAPRYRHYDGSYVFDMEKSFRDVCEHVNLFLLTTSDFNIMTDDGLGFDFTKREEEQNDFLKAFELSWIKHKYIIDVHDGHGKYKSAELIYNEVKDKLNNQ